MLTLLATFLLIAQGPEPLARLAGQVVDARGEPLPAAEVWVTPYGDAQVLARGRADGEGRYQLQVAAKEPVMVHATAAGKAVACTRSDPRQAAPMLRPIQVWDGTTLRGRVIDASGQPVAGAIVAVGRTRRTMLDIDVVEARTGANGRYELEHAPLGAVGLCAWAPGQALTERTAWLGHGGDEDLAFPATAPRTGTIRVAGLPAADTAGWRVRLFQSSGQQRVFPMALLNGTLDAEGKHLVAGLPTDVSFQVDVFDPQRQWYCKMTHLSERGADVVELQATRAEPVTWKTTLVDPAGAPIVGEKVRLHLGDLVEVVVTSAAGEVSITGCAGSNPSYDAYLLDSMRWTLDLPRAGRRPGPRTAPPSELRATPAASVTGRLLGAEGKPVAHASVILEGWAKNRLPRWMPIRTAATDGDGRFLLAGVPGGNELARLRVPGASSLLPLGPLASGEEVRLGDVTAAATGTIEGVILGASGKPIPGARVFLIETDHDGMDQAELFTGADGRFRFAPAATGTWQCSVEWPEGRDLEQLGQAFEVAPDKTAAHEFRSARDGTKR